MNTKKVGLRIKSLRGERGLKQEQVAEKIGIGRSTLSKIENGDIVPTAKILLELKALFITSIDWILTGEEYGESCRKVRADNEMVEMFHQMQQDKILKHTVLSCYYKSKTERDEG